MKSKLNKKIILSMFVAILAITNFAPICSAASNQRVVISSPASNDDLILYNNRAQITIVSNYNKDGERGLAYNALYPTYNYNDVYDTEEVSKDSFLWNVVVNGYPYKTVEELECSNYIEAFTATQSAIYCAYCGHSESDYSFVAGNEASLRTYNAFLKILENARNNQVSIDTNNVIRLVCNEEEWQVDSENPSNVYKTFKIITNYDIDTYKIELIDDVDASLKDTNNTLKNTFESNESFKITIPISKLESDGEFSINVITDVKTLPVYIGTSSENAYVLTAPEYQEKSTTFAQNYQENLASLNINVKEADTKIGIENSIINLLDEGKEKISTLTTNYDGKIFVEHLIPGKYYIEQIYSKDGYNVYKELIEVNMEYNKEVNVNINNMPKNIQNISNNQEDISITEEIIEKNVNNKYAETNIDNKIVINNEANDISKTTENNISKQSNLDNKNTNTNIENNTNITNENNEININKDKNNVDETTINNTYTENNNSSNNNVKNLNNLSNTSNISNISNTSKVNTVKTLENTSENTSETILVKTLPKTGM